MTQARHRGAGFTLVEILVVVVIVGIVISIATIATSVLGRDREVEDQARRLAAIMVQAREESDLQGRDLGVLFDPASYEFLYYEPRKTLWSPPADDDLLAKRALPEGLKFRLWLESREILLKTQAADKDLTDEELKKRAPHIMMLASGDVTPFELRIEREGTPSQWRVFSKPDNSVEAEEIHEQR